MNLQITSKDFYSPTTISIPKGSFIKIGKRKRSWVKVCEAGAQSGDGLTLTVKWVYKPSPKSTLRNKRSVFSKFKIELYV